MRFTKFDMADYLGSEEAIAAYLSAVMDEKDPDLLLAALGDIARARPVHLPDAGKSAMEKVPG